MKNAGPQNKNSKIRNHKGILGTFKTLLERNRLGELMVRNGTLTPQELRKALARQKESREHLGSILLRDHKISRFGLYRALTQQSALRTMAATAAVLVALSSFAIKPARAGSGIEDIPHQARLLQQANAAFGKVGSYPALFGTEEKRSANITPFSKWSDMFARFNREADTPQGRSVTSHWKKQLASFEGLPLDQMAEKVNRLVNKQDYIVDSRNWGKSDYWETPIEFFTRGGDCEDFAIAKYASLRALGVPEERLRIAIVHDKIKNIPHALLILYTDHGALVLDNQTNFVKASNEVRRYRPLFSINRTAWWLHTAPDSTVVASAR